MKIAYLDGNRFYRAIQVGGAAIIRNQKELDRINVFPVADADTGINLAMTVEAVLSRSNSKSGIKETLRSVADSALMGARGNSGIIFAQYLHGLSTELPDLAAVSVKHFAESAQKAVKHLYSSLMNPVEGTMITVIREWSEYLLEHSSSRDFFHLLTSSLAVAQKSLSETPAKLKLLAEANVVDAGAKGFVYFLEAVVDFIHTGSLRDLAKKRTLLIPEASPEVHSSAPKTYRFCSEAIVEGSSAQLEELKSTLCNMGDSLILAGSQEKMHIHIHTNNPDAVFDYLISKAKVSSLKVDDMLRQYQISHSRKYPIGILTDSACDLPDAIMDQYQISRLAFGINFGERFYLDKITLKPERFYQMLQNDKNHPVSSQASPLSVQSALDLMAEHYEKVFAIHISDKLSGIYQSAAAIIASRTDDKVHLVNSRQLSVSEGLVVLRVARAIEKGMSFEDISDAVETWIDNIKIYTDINTLKYMVRGGRVPPLAGYLADLLNLKPIVSLDREGKAEVSGKSFSRTRNMKKIIRQIEQALERRKLWDYAIVHADALERAEEYAKILQEICGKAPAYIMELSPVVGVHNGLGTVGIGVAYEPY